MRNKQVGQEIISKFRSEKEYSDYVGKAGILMAIVLLAVAFIAL